jgi:hypothetical protein
MVGKYHHIMTNHPTKYGKPSDQRPQRICIQKVKRNGQTKTQYLDRK